jgi:hypothetical protein
MGTVEGLHQEDELMAKLGKRRMQCWEDVPMGAALQKEAGGVGAERGSGGRARLEDEPLEGVREEGALLSMGSKGCAIERAC